MWQASISGADTGGVGIGGGGPGTAASRACFECGGGHRLFQASDKFSCSLPVMQEWKLPFVMDPWEFGVWGSRRHSPCFF